MHTPTYPQAGDVYIHTHTLPATHTGIHIHTGRQAYTHTYTHAFVHTRMHTHMHTSTHEGMHAYIPTCRLLYMYIPTSILVLHHAGFEADIHTCLRNMHTPPGIQALTYIHAVKLAYTNAGIHTQRHLQRLIHMHWQGQRQRHIGTMSYMHTHIHTYHPYITHT